MNRVVAVLAGLLCLVPPASASIAPPTGPSTRAERVFNRLPRGVDLEVARELTPPAKEEFQITEETDVRVDGRPCRYRDVPPNVVITQMEVGADKKTVLKILFRTRK